MSETVEFTADEARNRGEIDKITQALQGAYGGRVFSVTHGIDAETGVATLNASLAPLLDQESRPNFQLGQYQLKFGTGVDVELIVDHYREAIEDLADRET